MKRKNMQEMLLWALFAALSAILSQIAVPLGVVPINMTHLSIFTAAGLLGWKGGAASQGIYILLGAVGMPVFTSFTGGIGIVLGPTGGFIIAYPLCAMLTGFIIDRFGCRMHVIIPAMAAGMLVSYTLGIMWYMAVMAVPMGPAIAACMLPFLPGDAAKIALAAVLVRRLRPVLRPVPHREEFLSVEL